MNEKAGDDRRSGVIMWPGGTFPYQGKKATYLYEFDRDVDYFKRVDIVSKSLHFILSVNEDGFVVRQCHGSRILRDPPILCCFISNSLTLLDTCMGPIQSKSLKSSAH